MARKLPEPVKDDELDHRTGSEDPTSDSAESIHEAAAARRFLVAVIEVGFTVTTVLVVVGVILGRFGADLIGPLIGAWVASQSAVAYFYFRREP